MKRRRLCLGLVLVLGCATAPDLAGRHTLPDLVPGDTDPARGYEAPPRFRARKLLPEALRNGPHHRVTDPVTSDGFLHEFVLVSDFGRFEVAGDALLRQRLGEIAALAALREARGEPGFAGALSRARERPFITRWKLVDEPVGDPLGMPEAAWQELLAIAAMERTERADREQGALESYLRFERARSALAERLDVDAHAQNPVLQRELNRTALAVFAGGFPLEAVPAPEPPARGSHRPFASADARLAGLLSRDTPEDLRRVGRIELAVLGIPPAVRERVLTHRWITPRHLTILVAALVAMEGAADRAALIEAAVDARSEADALVYQRIAEMLRAIHEHVAPVRALDRGNRFVRATLADGRRVIPIEVDRLIWTGALERMVADAPVREDAETFDELWLSGSASARARTELAARGFVVVERAFERLETRGPGR
ncbi:MAG: hypothetical protein ABFS41_15185 [Myxococcota bacterium]